MTSEEAKRFIDKLNSFDISTNTISTDDIEWRLKNADLFNIIQFLNDNLSDDNYLTLTEQEEYSKLSDKEKSMTPEQIIEMKRDIETRHPKYFQIEQEMLDIAAEELAAKQELLDEYNGIVKTLKENNDDIYDEINHFEIELQNLNVDLDRILEKNIQLNDKLINLELNNIALKRVEEYKTFQFNQSLIDKFNIDLKEILFNSESDLFKELSSFNVRSKEENELSILTKKSELHLDSLRKALEINLRSKGHCYAENMRFQMMCNNLNDSNLVPSDDGVYEEILEQQKIEFEKLCESICNKENMSGGLIETFTKNKINEIKYELASNKLQRRRIMHNNIIELQKRITGFQHLCYFFQYYLEGLNVNFDQLFKHLIEINQIQTEKSINNVPILSDLIEECSDYIPSKKGNNVVLFFKKFTSSFDQDPNDENITWFFKYLLNEQIQRNSIITKSSNVNNIYQMSKPITDILQSINNFFSDSPTNQILYANVPFEKLLCDLENRFDKNDEFLKSSLARYNDCKGQLKNNTLFRNVFFLWVTFVLEPTKIDSILIELKNL